MLISINSTIDSFEFRIFLLYLCPIFFFNQQLIYMYNIFCMSLIKILMIINNNATLKGKQIIKGMNDQYRTYACSNDNTTIII